MQSHNDANQKGVKFSLLFNLRCNYNSEKGGQKI